MTAVADVHVVTCPHCGSRDEYSAPDPREHTCGHWAVLVPGVWPDMPEHAYHADPVPGGSLSSSGARKLLPPSCPAKFRQWADHPEPPSDAMDLGTAAHKLVLGAGIDIHIVEAPDYRTKAAREERDEASAAGKLPLLPKENAQVHAMADAIRSHPKLGRIFVPGNGRPEQSMFCRDPETGVWLRSRLDWMTDRALIVDLKTSKSANPYSFARSAADFGYHVQDAFYRHVYQVVTGEWPRFVFVVIEKEPPYLVSVCQFDDASVAYGSELVRQAIERYRDCTEAGVWPGYSDFDEIDVISLPPWLRARAEGQ